MAKVELKKPIVDEISACIKDAQSVVLVDYCGLTVEQDTQLRKNLREAGITYKVYKNTLMNFAFKGTEFEGLAPYLEGPNAIAVSTEDATAPARVLTDFAKTANKLEIKAGVVEGTVYDAKGMAAVASIPSREVLISKLLGSLQSPITNFARVMNQLAEKAEQRPAKRLGQNPKQFRPNKVREHVGYRSSDGYSGIGKRRNRMKIRKWRITKWLN